MSRLVEHERSIPVVDRVDVVVAGGGPAGLGASLAAARNGARVLLIERYGFLGGMITTGFVLPLPIDKLAPVKARGEKKPIVGGIAQEIVAKLLQYKGVIEPALADEFQVLRGFTAFTPCDPEMVKIVAVEMAEKSGVNLLLHSFVCQVLVRNSQVYGVIVENKSGRGAILADVVVDATGDGDVAAFAGAPFEKSTGSLLPMTLMFIVGRVDTERARETTTLAGSLKNEAVKLGLEQRNRILVQGNPYNFALNYVALPMDLQDKWNRKGEAIIWGLHCFGDSTNVRDLTDAEVTTRKRLISTLDFLRKKVPGYEQCYLLATAPQIGIRESRRIIGEYVLTRDDIVRGTRFDDVIARSRLGSGTLSNVGRTFDIPYRCLVPKGLDGMLTAGRCISLSSEAAKLFSPRDQISCIAIGQAAGTAAALATKNKCKLRFLDISALQNKLIKDGANLG